MEQRVQHARTPVPGWAVWDLRWADLAPGSGRKRRGLLSWWRRYR